MWSRALDVFRECGEEVYDACLGVAGLSGSGVGGDRGEFLVYSIEGSEVVIDLDADFVFSRKIVGEDSVEVDIGPWRVKGESYLTTSTRLLY